MVWGEGAVVAVQAFLSAATTKVYSIIVKPLTRVSL